ncbi:transcriptional regulator [Advenella faeciporci]|uniref:Transcriptional regulator n=1 Tax=Advenella faeciporci TaxID=797535 RepID=A0A918MXA2_9BURK|nr:transcriptional regulator [Advenella faeciporci]
MTDIVEYSGLSKPTVYRLIKELMACGMVMQAANRRYHLGHFAYELGLVAASNFNLRDICEPSLNRLAEITGDTVFLTVRSGDDSFCLDRKTGHFPVKVFSLEIGHRQPLGVGAAGLALLSQIPENEMKIIIQNNERFLGSYGGMNGENLLRLAQNARKAGYSFLSDFAIPGVSGIGMAVVDMMGYPVLSLSVTTISSRMTLSHQNEARNALQKEVVHLRNLLCRQNPLLLNKKQSTCV